MSQLDYTQGPSSGPLLNRLQFPCYLYINTVTASFLAPLSLVIREYGALVACPIYQPTAAEPLSYLGNISYTCIQS